jgi:acetylglutamate kinase
MTHSNVTRSEVLVQALPYIQRFQGKTIVVKYGGNAMISPDIKQAVMTDLSLLSCVGIRVVLVHGGGPEIAAVLKAMGKESHFVNGLRYTDESTMEVVEMVLCGKVNKDIVAMVEHAGAHAVGLSGMDSGLLKGHVYKGEDGKTDLGLVGEIDKVNTEFINKILNAGLLPVISSVAMNTGAENSLLNVNADTAAATIAVALGAEKLILMTDVAGVMKDVHDSDSLLRNINYANLESLIQDGTVNKGMIPKLRCCEKALAGGVTRCHIIDGRLPHALLVELFTDEGIGTMVE